MKFTLTLIALALASALAQAQLKIEKDTKTTSYGNTSAVTTSVMTPVSKNVSAGGFATSTYVNPSKGAGGPAPGNTVGSKTNTAVGVVRIMAHDRNYVDLVFVQSRDGGPQPVGFGQRGSDWR